MNNNNILLRTAELAGLADSAVGNNPRVGAVLVYQDRIIGEGYHRRAGEAHAEVHCLASVRKADRDLIPSSTLYVSLEPCCIKGRTPACTGLIMKEKIKKVVFSQRDTSDEVSGRGAAILREGGVKVKEYPNFTPTLEANAGRRVITTLERPFVLLKYAKSADGFLRPKDVEQSYWITNPLSRRLVHRWRANTNGILVGARTIVEDNPSLTTRLFPGDHARPIILDPKSRLTGKEKIFKSGGVKPLVFTGKKPAKLNADTIELKHRDLSPKSLRRVMRSLQKLKFGHLTVEGGSATLEAFLNADIWDEARVFTGPVRFGKGLAAPPIPANAELFREEMIRNDQLYYFRPAERRSD